MKDEWGSPDMSLSLAEAGQFSKIRRASTLIAALRFWFPSSFITARDFVLRRFITIWSSSESSAFKSFLVKPDATSSFPSFWVTMTLLPLLRLKLLNVSSTHCIVSLTRPIVSYISAIFTAKAAQSLFSPSFDTVDTTKPFLRCKLVLDLIEHSFLNAIWWHNDKGRARTIDIVAYTRTLGMTDMAIVGPAMATTNRNVTNAHRRPFSSSTISGKCSISCLGLRFSRYACYWEKCKQDAEIHFPRSYSLAFTLIIAKMNAMHFVRY